MEEFLLRLEREVADPYTGRMNKAELIGYLERLDQSLRSPATLFVYGSGACMLMDEPGRISMDLDVAGPYSQADERDLRRASEAAGLPVNPPEDYPGAHIEWVGPLRLCMPAPAAGVPLTLWQGSKLQVCTGSAAELIASKLIRYDETDRSDIQYLLAQARPSFEEIAAAASRLPAPFVRDALILENLENLRSDMAMWGF